MNSRRIAIFALSVIVPWMTATTIAQPGGGNISVGAKTSGSANPSQDLGRVGGYNTRGGGTIGGGSRSISELSAQASASAFGTTRRPTGGGGYQLPAALQPGLSGSSRQSMSGFGGLQTNYIAPWRPPTPDDLARLSGMDLATSMDTPEGGWSFGSGPQLRSSFVPPAPNRSTFQAFFGLTPAAPSRASTPENVGAARNFDLVAAINDANRARTREMARRALELFRLATDGNDDDDMLMPDAMDQLASVRDAQRDAYLPSILIAHGAMQRGLYSHAMNSLHEALLRNPEFFMAPVDLSQYFGSPDFYRRQLKELQQAGQRSSDSPHAAALEAYCSFLLGDAQRSRVALGQMQMLNARDQLPELITLEYALAAGLREQERRAAHPAPAPAATPAR